MSQAGLKASKKFSGQQVPGGTAETMLALTIEAMATYLHGRGEKLIISDESVEIMLKISGLAILDYDFLAREKLSPYKGAIAAGSIGTGKTLFFRSLNYILSCKAPSLTLNMVNARRISADYEEMGHKAVDKHIGHVRQICIDDLAAESTGRHYGKDAEAVAEFIQEIYDGHQRINNAKRLFATTNTVDGLKERYGERVLDRLKEMCHLFVWPVEKSFRQ